MIGQHRSLQAHPHLHRRTPPAARARLYPVLALLVATLVPCRAVGASWDSLRCASVTHDGPLARGLPPIDASTSLLVVSPHPDDETLCCAGVIRRVVAAGGHVSVVWITNGDGSTLSMLMIEKSLFRSGDKARDLATKRMAEARAATAILGVDSTRQFFLGYPDGGVRKLLADDSPASRGSHLERDFTAVLDRVQPTLILAPSPQDTHPDHAATGLLAIRALTRRGELAHAHFWIVHGGEGWPGPRGYMARIPLNMPPRGVGLMLNHFFLTDEEQTLKLRAVNEYHTQLKVMAPFLLAFVRTSELYSPLPVPLTGSTGP